MNWKELIESKECIDFRNEYKKYISKMNSREFVESMIKLGSEKTKINIIYSIIHSNPNIFVPKELKEYVIKHTFDYEPNYIEDFFDHKNIYSNEDLNKHNINKLYCEFKHFIKFEFGSSTFIPIKKELIEYFNEQKKTNEKIKNLSDLDCELMKLRHVI